MTIVKNLLYILDSIKIWNNENLINFKDFILNEFRIKGLDNITNINNIVEKQYISYDNDNNIEKSEYIILTDGINLINLRYINGINLNKTICNNIYDIYELYGIEVRSALIKELTSVLLIAVIM